MWSDIAYGDLYIHVYGDVNCLGSGSDMILWLI